MHKIFTCIFLVFLFVACNQQQEKKQQNEIVQKDSTILYKTFTPGKDTISMPKSIFLNTCPKPQTITIPIKSNTYVIIKSKDGSKTIKLEPPKMVQASFFSHMQNYDTEQGLALSTISYGHKSSICDRQGNLWFATQGGGVSRYDGKSFTNFTTAQGLASNIVVSIIEDKTGNLWFGTDGGGVSCYDGISFTNITTDQGLASNDVWSIAEDKKGNLWFGTHGGGVSRYDGKSFTNYTTTQGLVNNTVYCITEDKTGKIWFGTWNGVSKFDRNIFTNFTNIQGLANNIVLSITEDKTGKIWFGTAGGGVSRYDGKSFTNFTTSQGLANNNVWSITEDKTGNLWFGTKGCGVSRYDGKSFTNFTTDQGLANNIVVSITEDKTGTLWFGTNGSGVCRYDGKSFTDFTTAQGLANNTVYCITEDKTGNLWFGTNGGGASCYNGKSFTNFTTAQGLADNSVLSITKDKTGNLWFGTWSGVSKFDGKSFTNFTTNQGLVNNIVRSTAEDKTGNLWFGTQGGGVSRWDGKSFTNFTTAQGLANNIVVSITVDKMGNLWFGTYGGGVSRWDGKSFTNFTTAQRLADNNVMAIIQDQKGTIWAGTNLGLSGLSFQVPVIMNGAKQSVFKIIPAGLLIVTNDELKNYKPVWEIFNNSTGYPVKDVNGGSANGAMLCDSKGIIWIGTGDNKTALVRFDYNAILKNNQHPTVILQNIKVNNETICWYDLNSPVNNGNNKKDSLAKLNEELINFNKELTDTERITMQHKFSDICFEGITKFYSLPKNLVLPYSHNNITFEFNAVEPDRHFLVRYQYILEGYDNDWNTVTDKTSATFGNIFEGKYTFRLKACSPFGVWSEPIIYTFEVLPPWYRTWWMYVMCSIVLISALYLLYRWRVARLIKEKQVLEEKVKHRTAQLQQANEEIATQRDVVVTQKEHIEEIHKEVTDSINYAERIQRSFLATKELLNENLKEHFVFFHPKAVVSGDFYWASKIVSSSGVENFVLVTADSTGHGVPGAIMSILNISSLEKAVELGLCEPSEILNHTRKTIIERLKKDGSAEGGKDGMDASLICFDFANQKFTYSAANNPIWIIRENNLIELSPDKMSVGKHDKDQIPFTQQEFLLQKDDIIYTFTDGLPDQFGGPKGKKYKYAQLKELFLSINSKTMSEQKQMVEESLQNWKGDLEQVDDITILGFKV